MEDNCVWKCSPTKEWADLWAKTSLVCLCLKWHSTDSAVTVQCHPSCRERAEGKALKEIGWFWSAVYGSCKGTLAGPHCTAVKAAQHSRRVCKYKMSVLPQPDGSTALARQTTKEESRKKMHGQCSLFESSFRLPKSPSQLSDKQGKTQGFSFWHEVLFTVTFNALLGQ